MREARMGVQTLLLDDRAGRSDFDALCRAVQGIQEAGFKSIEMVPAQYSAHSGAKAAEFLQSVFTSRERKELRTMLQPFAMITVHGTNVSIPIRAGQWRSREDIWEPYIELLRFGRDIGAGVVTFHSLQRDSQNPPGDSEMADAHVRFGKVAAKCCEDWNLIAGYEFATTYEFFAKHRIVPAIGSKRFGYLVDVGHLALYCPDPPRVTPWVIELMGQAQDPIVEIHAGGVQWTSSGLREHRPMDRENVLDHKPILQLLESRKFNGPIIFEMFFETGLPDQVKLPFLANLEVCLQAKEKLLSM